MKQTKKFSLCVISLVFGASMLYAQTFSKEIAAFKTIDSIQSPAKDAILFVGSSSFTYWWNVSTYFPKHKIVNRGFGGSTILDQIKYEKEIIFKYNPIQIVIYCGENDLAASDTVSAEILCNRFKKLFTDIREKFPKIPVVYISMKPSPLRWKMKDKMMNANHQIKNFLSKKKNTKFVDVWDAMLDKDGLPIAEIFGEDKLHMNAKGYAIWQKLIEPCLLSKQ